jgi:hypothetical protein
MESAEKNPSAPKTKAPKADKTETLNIRINRDVMLKLHQLAGASHMEVPDYVRYWFGVMARLKPQYSTKAAATIPDDMFKGMPGRPSENANGE